MMFRIDKDRMRLLFAYGDRDIALAFAEMEGYEIMSWGPAPRPSSPSPVVFNEALSASRRMEGSAPEQVSPGVWSYKIGLKSRKVSAYVQAKRDSKRDSNLPEGVSDA